MTFADQPSYETPAALTPQDYPGLMQAVGELTSGDNETADYEVERWAFRGLQDVSWASTSTLWRNYPAKAGRSPNELELRRFESTIVGPARNWMRTEGLAGGLDAPNLLANLQHHGMWTRLLDLTSNPLTALFFASENPTVDGRLLAVDVQQLPSYRTDEQLELEEFEAPSGPVAKEDVNWRVMLSRSAATKEPFILWPAVRDARMRAQEGFFMASAAALEPAPESFPLVGMYPPNPVSEERKTNGSPIGHTFDDWNYRVKSIIIPAAIKKQVRTILRSTFGRSDRDVYPDIAGFIRHGGILPK